MVQVANRTVGPNGYGLMGLSWRPEPIPIEKALEAMKAAAESGATLWNGAEMYGTEDYNSMTLLKAYFTKYPEDADKITLILKGCVDKKTLAPLGSIADVRKSADNILAQLGGTKNVDVFGVNRRDHSVPFKDTLEFIQKEYIDTGKFGGISLAECSADTIREAVKYVKIAAVEVEVSMFTQDNLHNGVSEACAEHNIPIVAYSPMGRGILVGKMKTTADAAYLGFIGNFPRFQEENLKHNLTLTDKVFALAAKKGCTPSQLALGWVRSISNRPGMPPVIPIPGSIDPTRVQENSKVVELSEAEIKEIDDVLAEFTPSGSRYPHFVPTSM